MLARAHRRWSRIEAEQPDAYLRSALVRAHVSWRRRRSSGERVLAELPERRDDGDFASRSALRDELWQLLAGLSRAQRAVLVLRFFEDLDDHRIAEVMGCAEATVRVHASRGLAALRAAVRAAELPAGPIGEMR